jgi:nucleoside-diphosphate-sugar epimerase
MKRILITGSNSFVGKSFEKYISSTKNDEYVIDKISSRNEEWRKCDFSKYDVILNVAGIAHVEAKKSMRDLYYKVNRDLTIEIAKKAKDEGVKQYIYMSSMIVYGKSYGKTINDIKMITIDTEPQPLTFYGDSKLQAEKGILALQSQEFNIAIIRAPMIYSEEAKGNFPLLIKAAEKFPLFPNIQNNRSMIYIENLCEFIRLLIENESYGIFYPQNKEYINTSDLVYRLSLEKGRGLRQTKIFNPILAFLSYFANPINKAFGSYIYDKEISSHFDYRYCIVSYEESIKFICEKKYENINR